MPGYDYQAHVARDELVGKLKRHYANGMSVPVMCIVADSPEALREMGQASPDSLQFHWMHSIGSEEQVFLPASGIETKAAAALLKLGGIAATFPDNFYATHFRRLELLEDVNWGFLKDGSVIMFELPPDKGMPDLVMTPDVLCDPAIEQLKRRIESNHATYDRPVTLSDGKDVTPVLFGYDRLALRARQNAYRPDSAVA